MPAPQYTANFDSEGLPTNPDDLRTALTTMQQNGAPKEALQSVYDSYKAKYMGNAAAQPQQPAQAPQDQGILSKVGQAIGNAGNSAMQAAQPGIQGAIQGSDLANQGYSDVSQAISGTGQDTSLGGRIEQGLGGIAKSAGGIIQAGANTIAAPVEGAIGGIASLAGQGVDIAKGQKLGTTGQQVQQGVSDVVQPIVQSQAAQDIGNVYNQIPYHENISSTAGALANLVPGTEGVTGAVGDVARAAGDVVAPVAERAGQAVSDVAGAAAGGLEKSAAATTDAQTTKGLTDLLTPEQTAKGETKDILNASGEGRLSESGTITPSQVAPSEATQSLVDEAKKVEGIDYTNPVQALNKLSEAQNNVLENIKSDLGTTPISDVVSNSGVALQNAKNDFIKAVQESGKSASTPEAENLANRYANQVATQINRKDISTVADVWDLRKYIDNLVIGKSDFGTMNPDKKEALQIVRNHLNNAIEAMAPNTKDQFRSWSKLQDAREIVAQKAQKNMNSTVGRIVNKAQKVLGVRNSLIGAAAIGGAGVTGMLPAAAGIAAGVGIPTYMAYRAGKWILSPQAKNILAQALRKLQKATKSSNPKVVSQAAKDYQEIKKTIAEVSKQVKGTKGGFRPVDIAHSLGFKVPEEPLGKNKAGTASMPKELQPLAEEAKKYKSAEEFVKSNILKKDGVKYLDKNKYSFFGDFMKDIEKLNPIKNTNEIMQKSGEQFDIAKGIWGNDVGHRIPKNIEVSKVKIQEKELANKPTSSRKITEPIEVIKKGNKYLLVDGRHRLDQALFNKDNKIQAIVKDESHIQELTDLWNQVHGK